VVLNPTKPFIATHTTKQFKRLFIPQIFVPHPLQFSTLLIFAGLRPSSENIWPQNVTRPRTAAENMAKNARGQHVKV